MPLDRELQDALDSLRETNVGFFHDIKRHVDERLDGIEKVTNRSALGNFADDKVPRATKEQRAAWNGYLRGGRESLSPDRVNVLQVGNDLKGGFLAPAEWAAELVKEISQFSPIRQITRVGKTSSGVVQLPRRTSTLTGRWVGELESRTATEPTYGLTAIPVREIACYVDISTQMLEDSQLDFEAELKSDFAEEFGRVEGAAFVSGDGLKSPLGILSNENVTSVNSGLATSINADSLITAFYALPPAYRGNATWLCNGTTLSVIRKLKDGSGQFLWQPSLIVGQPASILGRPILEAVDMPDCASGSYPVVFGDFFQAFRVYDLVELSVLRDPFSIATTGQTRFHGRRRVGGGVVQPAAIRKIKCST